MWQPDGVPGTAQDALQRLLKDVVAPALRAEGLQGSGKAYVLPDPVYWAQVGFQGSYRSTADATQFTINLKVTSKAAWDEARRDHSPVKDTPPPGVDRAEWDARRLKESAYPLRPSANIFGGGTMRIGHLIPSIGRDHWWTLTVANARPVVDDALDALVRYGLPWLRQQVAKPLSAGPC